MTTEVEDVFRGVFVAESCCSQGQALAPGTVQLDRVVGQHMFWTSAVGLPESALSTVHHT